MSLKRSSQPCAVIVEDDDKLIDIFSKATILAGFQTTGVKNGADALDILKSIQPEIIVLDLHLPGLTGDRLLDEIRRHELLKNTQIILATADPAMADMLREKSDYVLEKPISFSQLRDLAIRIRLSL